VAIDVVCEMSVIEINGKDAPPVGAPRVVLKSHWVYRDTLVRLTLPGVEKGSNIADATYTVSVEDLRAALNACTGR
jgi:hypothetical protein